MVAEQIHRYPRWITWALDLLAFLAVGAALLLFSRDFMALLWKSYGIDTTLMAPTARKARRSSAQVIQRG